MLAFAAGCMSARDAMDCYTMNCNECSGGMTYRVCACIVSFIGNDKVIYLYAALHWHKGVRRAAHKSPAMLKLI